MDATLDHSGRPTVVVTGMGVLTSLGQGKAENWHQLLQGVSGIRRISRFPIAHLRTTIAGTVDFVSVHEPSAPALTEAIGAIVAEEALAEAGIGERGDFPGPLLVAMPPVEMEWPQRLAAAEVAARNNEPVTWMDLIHAVSDGRSRPGMNGSCSARWRSIWRSGSAPRARRSPPPPPVRQARRRSSLGSRRSAGVKPRRLW